MTTDLLYDTGLFWLTQVLFFGFGWLFFLTKLFKDYEVKKTNVQLLFSLTLALSCSMFELIIFEIVGVMSQKYVFIIILFLFYYHHYTIFRKIYNGFISKFNYFLSSRKISWQIDFFLMLINLVVILPFYQIYLIVSSYGI